VRVFAMIASWLARIRAILSAAPHAGDERAGRDDGFYPLPW
jgi:hypothetical protein